MITIMKTYNSPMLQVVSIKRSDIIATSDQTMTIYRNGTLSGGQLAPGQRDLDDYYEEY